MIDKEKNLFNNFKKNKYIEEIVPRLKEDKTKKFTTLVLTLIAFSFFGLFAISPTLSTIAGLKKQLKDNQFIDQELDKKISNLSTLQQKYLLLSKNLPNIFSAIPYTPTVTAFTGQIQSIAKDSNVGLRNFTAHEVSLTGDQIISTTTKNYTSKPLVAIPNNEYLLFAFSLIIEGSDKNISNFISTLVSFERIITIDSFTITKGIDDNQVLTLRGKAYFKK